ncbi:protein shortage in chiasmata 1 ortholog-like [Thalassophryne amazonica]|uniref:protein shortage in chiasmata 1 ortholog-like n=1 Tax=Thalassophryne amazonica TaxID=390379 RepID=UPI001471757F|nr:protein shortage in chiasmata 1 ortholog-like [Thalassophryne amazonica]
MMMMVVRMVRVRMRDDLVWVLVLTVMMMMKILTSLVIQGLLFGKQRTVFMGTATSLQKFSFHITLNQLRGDLDVIPSSNPNSPNYLNQDEYYYLLKESENRDPCQETFFKLTPEEMRPQNEKKDLLLPEEIMVVDHLPQFRTHLPTLKAKLSRLRTLPVADPLQNSLGNFVSKDSIFRHCASYKKPPSVCSGEIQACADINEEYVKEPLLSEESLLLPVVMDTLKENREIYTTFSSICSHLNVASELLDEQISVIEVLQKVTLSVSAYISKYDRPKEINQEFLINGAQIDFDFSEHMLLPTEMELDLTLSSTPENSPTHWCVSTRELPEEQLTPLGKLSLMSEKVQKEMELALWMAEKHPSFILHFILAEPQICEPVFDFQLLSDALKLMKVEKQSFANTDDNLQLQMDVGIICEFTESINFECPSTKEDNAEDFCKISLHYNHYNVTINNHLDKKSVLSEPVITTTKAEATEKFSEVTAASPHFKNTLRHMSRDDLQLQQPVSISNQSSPSIMKVSDRYRDLQVFSILPERDLDPLSSFMMLRSQHTAPVTGTPQGSDTNAGRLTKDERTNPVQSELQSPLEQRMHRPDKNPACMSASVSRSASREQTADGHFISLPVNQNTPQDLQGSRVVQVQASDSQQHAFCELLTFAQPHLCSARQLGLNFSGLDDFSCLALDQTHFLLKQQEKAVYRTQTQSTELLRDQELLFNQVTMIHLLVTVKELLLRCSLITAVEFLTKAAETCTKQTLQQLMKRLQIILYLSHRNQEPNFKLLELQQQLASWLHNIKAPNNRKKILVILTVECDDARSIIIEALSQVTAVTAVSPEDAKTKVNGACMINRIHDSMCVVVYDQHIGADFPWQSFSLVVEYDHPGQSPWVTVCRERSISHLTFHTVLQHTEKDSCLGDNVPYILCVTEGLLNCPLLLQTLESVFNISVLERSHSPSLQILGGTHHYVVITVDESTAIMVQEQGELCQQRSCEAVVMRLTALSLQYSCCWLILHWSDSQGGGFSSEAYNNLVLIYSSLVLFGMRSPDLDIKVLIVTEVLEIAKWISQICFHTLMTTDRDPVRYLDRDWLTVLPSEEEICLSQFPCINPLVGQLMLQRAPSLEWLLRASLSQLKELLGEVPHKVLKLFSDITSLYMLNAESSHQEPEAVFTGTLSPTSSPNSTWTLTAEDTQSSPLSEPFCTDQTGALLLGTRSFCDQDTASNICNVSSDFKQDLSSSFGSPEIHLQQTWTCGDPWKEEAGDRVRFSVWSSTAGTVGRVVERTSSKWPQRAPSNSTDASFLQATSLSTFTKDSTVDHMTKLQQRVDSHSQDFTDSSSYRDPHRLTYNPSPAPDVLLWCRAQHDLSSCGDTTSILPNYGPKCWVGRERKRNGELAGFVGTVLTPLKRGRLSYERVPGRSDGQTRLKFF